MTNRKHTKYELKCHEKGMIDGYLSAMLLIRITANEGIKKMKQIMKKERRKDEKE